MIGHPDQPPKVRVQRSAMGSWLIDQFFDFDIAAIFFDFFNLLGAERSRALIAVSQTFFNQVELQRIQIGAGRSFDNRAAALNLPYRITARAIEAEFLDVMKPARE